MAIVLEHLLGDVTCNIHDGLQIALLLVPAMVKAQTLPTVPIYSYSVPGGGYAGNGNLTNYTDSVTGTWSLQYDNVNRLQGASATTAGPYNTAVISWEYDAFGNRTKQQLLSGTPNTEVHDRWATYDASNRMTTSDNAASSGILQYDGAGNMTFDGIHQIKYDAENRVCAAFNTVTGVITQYLYDAEGHRVAKGHPTSNDTLYCPSGTADFIPDETYVVGQNGEQISELDSSGQWIHSNVNAGGQLIATYSQDGNVKNLHFNITDPLGTKRVQASALGGVDAPPCLNLPFGDGPSCVGATEHFFTGKERDAESGLDYFGARYYASSMGRFMSPDWAAKAEPVPYAKLDNPQSLNLYGYVQNNPLSRRDPDGHLDCSGTNAAGPGCQAIAAWNVAHGIAQALTKSFYLKVESGVGFEVHGKGALGKAQIGVKSVRETNAKFDNKGTVKKVDEAGAKVKVGPVSIGPSVTREQAIQTGNGPTNYDAPSEVHGNLAYDVGEQGKGSNWEIGVGFGAYLGVGGGIEVGFDAKELALGVKEALSGDPKPEEKKD